MDDQPVDGPAAFACVHVIRDSAPVLLVARDSPVDARDSGWRFGCGREGHSSEDWLMVSAERLLGSDSALDPLRGLPFGHAAARHDRRSDWEAFEVME